MLSFQFQFAPKITKKQLIRDLLNYIIDHFEQTPVLTESLTHHGQTAAHIAIGHREAGFINGFLKN